MGKTTTFLLGKSSVYLQPPASEGSRLVLSLLALARLGFLSSRGWNCDKFQQETMGKSNLVLPVKQLYNVI